MPDSPPLTWSQEDRPGRGPSHIATVDGRKVGFVSDRGEHADLPEGAKRCRWQVWQSQMGGEVDTAEDGRTAVEAEWARLNEEQEA